MSKYIIKNCPALTAGTCNGEQIIDRCFRNCCIECEKISDCLLKQIVKKCNEKISLSSDYATNAYSGGVYHVAREILDLLDISEVE